MLSYIEGNNMVSIIEIILLLVYLIIAVCIDMRERRIPNKLIGIGLLSGIILIVLQMNNIYLYDRVGAFFLGIAILFIPFAMGGIGAGDVKLLGLVGLFVGIKTLINISLISFLIGGAFALIVLALARLKQFKNIHTVGVSFINSILTKRLLLGEEGKLTLPFSIPIGIGTFIVVIFKWSIF